VGTAGALSVVIGVAGSGKSTAVLKPLANAWQQRALDVLGTAQAWRQAKDLRSGGINPLNVRALDPCLDSVHEGRIRLNSYIVVVLGRVGTR
jgi:nucleoside-triphosphatase THEP1